MPEPYLEIELRYKVADVADCLKKLALQDITVARQERLVDEWHTPTYVHDLAAEQQWFDHDHGVAWRIRRIYANDKETLEVTSKQLTDDNNHNSFHETTAQFASYKDAVAGIAQKGQYNWLTIDKTRYFLTSANPAIPNQQFELVVDHIEGLADKIGVGACLEIEYKGTASRDQALADIARVAALCGFSADDLFQKSLTVESMTALAHFGAK